MLFDWRGGNAHPATICAIITDFAARVEGQPALPRIDIEADVVGSRAADRPLYGTRMASWRCFAAGCLASGNPRGPPPTLTGSIAMPDPAEAKDHVYKILDLVGSSEKGIEDAIQNAITRASKTVRSMKWFEVVQTRGHIEEGSVRHYQVTLRVGFTLEA